MDSSEVDPPDAVVAGVGDVEVEVPRVNGDAKRSAQLGRRGRTAIARQAPRPAPGKGGDDPCCEVNPADAVVGGLSDVEVPRVNGEAKRAAEPCCRRRAAIAPEARDPGPGEGGDGPCRQIYPSDAVVAEVADVEVPRVDSEESGSVELRRCGGSAIAPEARDPGPRKGGDNPCRQVHPADAVVAVVTYVEVPRGNGDAKRVVELRRRRQASIAGGGGSAPGEGGDGPRRQVHPADAVADGLSDVEIR